MALPGFDITDITGYVDQHSYDLISKTVLTTDLANEMNVRVGLKGDVTTIPVLGGEFTPGNGAQCGFTPQADDVEITQVSMTLANKKFNQAYCPQILRDTFLSESLAAGAMGANESLSFGELLSNYFVENLKKWNEGFIINGEGAIDGLKDIIVSANGAAVQAGTPAAWTVQNAIAQAQDLALAIPSKVANDDDLIMVVSPEAKRTLQLAITQENYYHIAPGEEVYVPGTSVKVVASSGLEGSDYKFAGKASGLYLGTDLTSDFEEFKLMYAEAEDQLRAIMRWRIGVTVAEVSNYATNAMA